jgi:HEAT repeat protein
MERTFSQRGRSLAVLALVSLGLGGCANFWDDVTSKKFREHPYDTLFTTPDAYAVLRNPESDGDERAKALRRLKEPATHGGAPAQQEEALHFLSDAAMSDHQPLCRLAAVETLGRYKDPRASQILLAAYARLQPAGGGIEDVKAIQARHELLAEQSFPPETATLIQCRTLVALGQTHQPEALSLLVQAARTPVKPDASETEKLQVRDLRVAAVRALGNYPGDRQAAAALVQVMQGERDVAVRDRTQESLVAVTGRQVPNDPAAWENYLQNPEAYPKAPSGVVQQVGAWFKP